MSVIVTTPTNFLSFTTGSLDTPLVYHQLGCFFDRGIRIDRDHRTGHRHFHGNFSRLHSAEERLAEDVSLCYDPYYAAPVCYNDAADFSIVALSLLLRLVALTCLRRQRYWTSRRRLLSVMWSLWLYLIPFFFNSLSLGHYILDYERFLGLCPSNVQSLSLVYESANCVIDYLCPAPVTHVCYKFIQGRCEFLRNFHRRIPCSHFNNSPNFSKIIFPAKQKMGVRGFLEIPALLYKSSLLPAPDDETESAENCAERCHQDECPDRVFDSAQEILMDLQTCVSESS